MGRVKERDGETGRAAAETGESENILCKQDADRFSCLSPPPIHFFFEGSASHFSHQFRHSNTLLKAKQAESLFLFFFFVFL